MRKKSTYDFRSFLINLFVNSCSYYILQFVDRFVGHKWFKIYGSKGIDEEVGTLISLDPDSYFHVVFIFWQDSLQWGYVIPGQIDLP